MPQETCYGVICDIHGAKELVPKATKILKEKGADCLVLNGDIADMLPDKEESKTAIAFVVEEAAKTGLDVYVQPGSHEKATAYFPALGRISKEYSNVHDCLKEENQKVDKGSHQIVFLPGSDALAGGDFLITCDNRTISGLYERKSGGYIHISNMNDLRTLVDSPETTLVFCHIPPKFENLKEGIDLVEFGRATREFHLNEIELPEDQPEDLIFPKGVQFPIKLATKLYNLGLPVKLVRETRGNKNLRGIYKESGVRKAVSGHFHESGQRANYWSGETVPQNTYSKSLFYNPGPLAEGCAGLYTIRGQEAYYENVKVDPNSKGVAEKFSAILGR